MDVYCLFPFFASQLSLLFVSGIRDEPWTNLVLRLGNRWIPLVHRVYIPSFIPPSCFFYNISRIIYTKLMYKLRVAPHANILEICCNPVDEFHFWLMYINITRCATLNEQ